jgi:hypothetical protein
MNVRNLGRRCASIQPRAALRLDIHATPVLRIGYSGRIAPPAECFRSLCPASQGGSAGMAVPPDLFQLECDAPPYSIITGCRLIGFARPEDVRWCRSRLALPGPFRRLVRLVRGETPATVGLGRPKDVVCICGVVVYCCKYQFTFNTGHSVCYRLGQCRYCSTIHWDDA